MFLRKVSRTALAGLIAAFAGSSASGTETTELSAATALPNAQPGECYAKVMVPAQYKTETEQVVKRDAYEEVEIVPAKYETVSEKVVIKEASEKLVPVPATYEDTEEIVEVESARTEWLTSLGRKSRAAGSSLVAGAMALGLPKSAKPGRCFQEFHQTAKYDTETQNIVKKEASFKIEVIPAKYEWVTEKVMVKQAAEKLLEVEPEYETVSEKVLVSPAYTTWKKGRGPVERIDGTTGEIMCLIEVPAKYTTIEKRVLKTPAATKKIEIPAEYTIQKVRKLVSAPQEKKIEIPAVHEKVTKKVKIADAKTEWRLKGTEGPGEATENELCLRKTPAKYETVVKRMMNTPATVKKIEIPAEYKAQKVRKLVSAAQEKRTKIPAEMQTVNKQVKVSDARMEWRPVLCETNMSKDLNIQIQQALEKAGHDPGPVDGVLGDQTMRAVDRYQVEKGLPRGGLTMRTMNELGIQISRK